METNDEKKARVTFEQPEKARISEEDLRFVASYQRDNKHYLQQPEAAGQEQEELLSDFLLWVEMNTHYFEDKDVTPSQVVQAYLTRKDV